jgi:hypothetical protein
MLPPGEHGEQIRHGRGEVLSLSHVLNSATLLGVGVAGFLDLEYRQC